MSEIYRFLAVSPHPAARAVRALRRGVLEFTLPAPRVAVKPMLWAYLACRSVSYFVRRVFICEPLLKAYCKRHGRRVRTDIYIHYIAGKGDIILGDDVVVNGKCGFHFAARFAARPTLEVGDHTYIGHNCQVTVGRRVTIGRHCLIAADVRISDASGHPTDPVARRAGLPPDESSVRPVVIGDNVWIGASAIILKGVTVGAGAVIGAGSVVTRDVPPNVLAAGNPARVVRELTSSRPEPSASPARI